MRSILFPRSGHLDLGNSPSGPVNKEGGWLCPRAALNILETVVFVQFINSHTEFSIQNLLQTVEEREAYGVQIACKGQEHDVGYVQIERLGEMHQAGVVLSCPLPELLGPRL